MTCVKQFHIAFNQPAPNYVNLRPDADLVRLRARLIREEFEEVMAEFAKLAKAEDPRKVHAIYHDLLKELADLRYVLEGAAVSFGLPIDEAYREVHRSNMSKLGIGGRPVYRADGKVLKGPDYTPADMSVVIPQIIDQEGDPS